MSIERCDRHDRRYDTDFLEQCPRCEGEDAERHQYCPDEAGLCMHDAAGLSCECPALEAA